LQWCIFIYSQTSCHQVFTLFATNLCAIQRYPFRLCCIIFKHVKVTYCKNVHCILLGNYPTVNYFSIDRERFSSPFIASNPMIYNATRIHFTLFTSCDRVSFLSLQQFGDKCFSNKLTVVNNTLSSWQLIFSMRKLRELDNHFGDMRYKW